MKQRILNARWRLARWIAPAPILAIRPSESGLARVIVMPPGWERGEPILELRLSRWQIRQFKDPGHPDLDATGFGEANKTYLVAMRRRFFTGRIG